MTETNSKVQLKTFLWVLQTARTCPNERFERSDFLSNLSNSTLFQTFIGKYTARLSKAKSTRAEEPMTNEVLIRSSLIPKIVFEFWIRYFGFRLKHFTMVGDTAFYAFRERSQQETFRNIFCFLIVTGLWVKAFLTFGRSFRRVVQSALYVSRGHLEVKLIFFKSSKTHFLGNWAKKNCHFSTKYFPERLSKIPCSLPD